MTTPQITGLNVFEEEVLGDSKNDWQALKVTGVDKMIQITMFIILDLIQ